MRALLTLLAGLALIYVALGVALYLFQGSMVFLANLPGRALEATPADIGLNYEDVQFDTADGERLHGWYVPAVNARGVLLFFHGNAGNISHRLESIMIFNRLGLDVLIVDYRGYGQSTGKPTESGTYRDAQAAWDYLLGERQAPPGRIVIFGRSLGGAVGAWLAAGLPAEQAPAAVIIESSFTSGADMARRLYPIFPARLLTRLKYPVVGVCRPAALPGAGGAQPRRRDHSVRHGTGDLRGRAATQGFHRAARRPQRRFLDQPGGLHGRSGCVPGRSIVGPNLFGKGQVSDRRGTRGLLRRSSFPNKFGPTSSRINSVLHFPE